MGDYCVVVASEANARFFTLEPVEFPEFESGPRLVDRGEILHPEKGISSKNLYTDSKTGRGRSPGGARAHGYDDHRSQHVEEFSRQFAKEILEKTKEMTRSMRARYVVLAAPSRMLGYLRQDLDILHKQGVEVRKLAKDMIKFNSKQIHEYLAKERCLPACKLPGR